MHRALVALLGLLAAVFGSAALSAGAVAEERSSAPSAPGTWSVSDSTVTWRPPEPLPTGDAQVQVVLDGAALDTIVSADGSTVRATLPSGTPQDAVVPRRDLAVMAAGRRLDASGPATDAPATAAPTSPADLPLAKADPLRPGPLRTVTGEYSGADLPIGGYPALTEFRALVVAPERRGPPRPLVLFLHGRHATCFRGPAAETTWPCRESFAPVPSYRGYAEAQQLLASRGYVTVSISANGINAQDRTSADGGAAARGQLVGAHLRAWEQWSAGADAPPEIVRLGARADLQQVVLVGHSRGGEGVNRAALDALTPGTPWSIRGLVHLAPTAFAQNPVAGVPAASLLPTCDGDVFDLQGQSYVDAGRRAGRDPVLRSSVLIGGANHNFFNTEWTPGESAAPSIDDASFLPPERCGRAAPGRLTPAEQRRVGALYISAAVDSDVRTNDGGATALLDGSAVRPRGVEAAVFTHAVGGRRIPVVLPSATTEILASGPSQARRCSALRVEEQLAADACGRGIGLSESPHLGAPLPPFEGLGSRAALQMSWTGPRAEGLIPVGPSGASVDLRRSEELHLRVVGVGEPLKLSVRLTDRAGRSVLLPAAIAPVPDASEVYGRGVASELRYRLPRRGIDRRQLASITLLPETDVGSLLLLDAWGWSEGRSPAAPLRLSRVDANVERVDEGDEPREAQVNLTVTPASPFPATIRVRISGTTALTPGRFEEVTIPAGATSLAVPFRIDGDRRDGDDLSRSVTLQSTDTAVAGQWQGVVRIIDDDPAPTATASPVASEIEVVDRPSS